MGDGRVSSGVAVGGEQFSDVGKTDWKLSHLSYFKRSHR